MTAACVAPLAAGSPVDDAAAERGAARGVGEPGSCGGGAAHTPRAVATGGARTEEDEGRGAGGVATGAWSRGRGLAADLQGVARGVGEPWLCERASRRLLVGVLAWVGNAADGAARVATGVARGVGEVESLEAKCDGDPTIGV